MALRKTLLRIYHWEYLWLVLIVALTLAAHISIIKIPDQLVLDEQHYVKDARYILANHETQRPEHPPLAKLFIVVGITIFGDNQWGWRIPSIFMGTIGIAIFYFICRRLKLSRNVASLATFLYGFENFTFLQASLAMLDVFMVTLMLAAFLLYLYREYILAGVFLALSALSKMFAALAAPTMLIHWLFSRGKRSWWFWLTAFFAPVSFIVLMPLFDFAISRHFQNPAARIKEMLSLMSSLTFYNTSHPALSRPWEWVLNYKPMAYWYTPHYTGAISLSIWLLIIPTVLYMIYRAARGNEAGLFGAAWFFGTYLLWIPISIITNRVSFIFYFYPTIGALCLGLGAGLGEAIETVSSKKMKIRAPVYALIGIFLLFHLASFVILTPVFFRS